MIGTSLIGREKDLVDLEGRFERGHRLVSIVGPGGIGKTRLARELAKRSTIPAAFVDLSEARCRADISDALATALRLPFSADASELQTIVAELSARDAVLLVFDNFEQLVDDAPLLSELCAYLTSARLLVTSREMLRLEAESVFELAPLAVSRETETADSRTPAVGLFCERFEQRCGRYESGAIHARTHASGTSCEVT